MFTFESLDFSSTSRLASRSSQSLIISSGRCIPEAVELAALGENRGVAAIDLGVDLGVRGSELLHRLGRRPHADRVENEVRGRVVGEFDHEPDRVAEGERRSVREVIRQNPEPGTLSIFASVRCELRLIRPAAACR